MQIGLFQILGAQIAANILTFFWVLVVWRIGRRERAGKEPGVFQAIFAAMPGLLVAYGFWLAK